MGNLFRHWPIGRKVSLAVMVAVGLGCGAMVVVESLEMRGALLNDARSNGMDVTRLLASSVAGGVRWAKPDAIERAYMDFVSREGSTVSDIATYDAAGNLLTDYRAEDMLGYHFERAHESHRQALASEQQIMLHEANHLVVYAPLHYGKANERIGTLAVAFSLEELEANVSQALTKQGMIAGVTIVGVVVVLLFLMHTIVLSPLRSLIGHVRAIAEEDGDLTRRLQAERKDELGELSRWINTFVERIQKTVIQLTGAAEKVSESAVTTASATEQASESLGNQQADIQKVAAAATQMSATVTEVARSTSAAAEAAEEAEKSAQNGHRVVRETVEAIQGLADEVERVAAVIHRLESDSESIGTVLDVIREVADRTNLLALNAAIEAARAGEEGRGFAVVAEEVRTLANRTRQSTEEIQKMIERLQTGAGEAVSAMEQGRVRTRSSVEKAGAAGQSLEAINAAVETIKDMSNQIAIAAEQHTQVAESVNQSIVTISKLTDDVVRSGQAAATSSKDLSGTAADLHELVSAYRV